MFSDTHLTHLFNQSKYTLLYSLIKSSDQVIINGDFWDGYIVTFDTFINSEWKKLFPLLKEKKCIYIAGNHDEIKMLDKRTNLFASQLLTEYTLTSGDSEIFIEHGDRHLPDTTAILQPPESAKAFIQFASSIPNTLEKGGNRLTKWNWQERVIPFFYRKLNQTMKDKSLTERKDPSTYIVHGHSHNPEFDLENRYINLGCIKGGVASYLLVEDGKLTFKKEIYTPLSYFAE